MKQAIKAFSIGDKLHNMERIHSKLVTFTSVATNSENTNEVQLNELQNSLKSLDTLVNCMAKDIESKYVTQYKQAISQALKNIENKQSIIDKDLFNNCRYLHSTFAHFRRNLKQIIKRGCEIQYQKVCSPLFLIEVERE